MSVDRSTLKILLVASLALALLSSCASAADRDPAPASPATDKGDKNAKARDPMVPAGFETAVFAGGCFWCMEPPFEKLPGVISVTSGYTGGGKVDPTYEEVGAGGTGHAEAIKIVYDPRKVAYARLLDVYWHNVDPTSPDGQFCDRGLQYRPAIYYRDATQKRLAEASKRRLETTPQRFKPPVRVEIVPASAFYPAEVYHQDFYKKDPLQYNTYRLGCGRDRRIAELWGKAAAGAH